MTPKSKTGRRHLIKTAELGDIENRIRSRAYQLYEPRGSVDGFDWDELVSSGSKDIKGAEAAEGQISQRCRAADAEWLNEHARQYDCGTRIGVSCRRE